MKMYDVNIGQQINTCSISGFVREATKEHMKPEYGNYIFMDKTGRKCVIVIGVLDNTIAMGYFNDFTKQMKELDMDERE
jgi:hypothetical protein